MSYIKIILTRVCISYFFVFFIGCDIQDKDVRKTSSTYVKPYVTRSGKLVRGSVRKSWSSSPNRIKNQNKSKSYYNRNPNRKKLNKN